MCLQVHLRIKHDEFLVQTLPIWAKEVVFAEMVLQIVVVEEVLRPCTFAPAVAKMATLVLFSTMCV
jgi:hypothetical protein